MLGKSAVFRFYEELNDFLTTRNKKKELQYHFFGSPKIKDAIESFGIPHTEVDMILVNGESVDYSYKLKDKDRVAVYPKFETLDISMVSKLQHSPLRKIKFVIDVHLGKLARYLRLIGFDSLYHNKLEDKKIVELSNKESRIILTRDKGILKYNHVTHGYYLRSDNPKEQLEEVIKRFDLKNHVDIFSRCMECNGLLKKVSKKTIEKDLLEGTKNHFNDFYKCETCSKIYWKGSHYESMMLFIESVLKEC